MKYTAEAKELKFDGRWCIRERQAVAAAKEHTGARGTVCWWLYEDEGRSALGGARLAL